MKRPDGPTASADEPVDVEAIMLTLREEIRQRRASTEAQGVELDAPAHRMPPPVRLPPALHEAVFDAELAAHEAPITPTVPHSRLPLVGRFVDRLRARAHRLVLSYIDLAARRQSAFNVRTAAALSQLVATLEAEEAARAAQLVEIAALRREIERLQQRIDALERRT